jgi:hypothetical protein
MAGLDPAIHGVPSPPASTRIRHGQDTRNRVDAPVKPGHDESKMDTENEILPERPYPDPFGLKAGHDHWGATGAHPPGRVRPAPHSAASGADPWYKSRHIRLAHALIFSIIR